MPMIDANLQYAHLMGTLNIAIDTGDCKLVMITINGASFIARINTLRRLENNDGDRIEIRKGFKGKSLLQKVDPRWELFIEVIKFSCEPSVKDSNKMECIDSILKEMNVLNIFSLFADEFPEMGLDEFKKTFAKHQRAVLGIDDAVIKSPIDKKRKRCSPEYAELGLECIICQEPVGPGEQLWIQCRGCEGWCHWHCSCAGVPYELAKKPKFEWHCRFCA